MTARVTKVSNASGVLGVKGAVTSCVFAHEVLLVVDFVSVKSASETGCSFVRFVVVSHQMSTLCEA